MGVCFRLGEQMALVQGSDSNLPAQRLDDTAGHHVPRPSKRYFEGPLGGLELEFLAILHYKKSIKIC
jgi:hypothetical protein